MKKIIYILALSVVMQKLNAQQLPLYTQYLSNPYLINPAVAGTNPYFEVMTNSRYQWVGFTDAPRTHVLSLNGPYQKKNIGLGGMVFTDITGPTRRNGLQLSYAYHLKLTEGMKLSLGVSGGLLQYAVDGGKITLSNNNDPALSTGFQSTVLPDFGFGAYLYSEKYYAGISAPQLVPSKIKFFDYYKNTMSKLTNHFYIFGGYKYKLNEQIMLEPNMLIKYGPPAPVQFDIGVRGHYKKMIMAGVSLRTLDAIALQVGYLFQENVTIGYSYDASINGLKGYNSGSHEIVIGIRFNKGYLTGEEVITVE